MSERRYVLIQDGDGQWCVCPSDKQEEAHDYFRAMAAFWAPGATHEGRGPIAPYGLESVGGDPGRVTFADYSISE